LIDLNLCALVVLLTRFFRKKGVKNVNLKNGTVV